MNERSIAIVPAFIWYCSLSYFLLIVYRIMFELSNIFVILYRDCTCISIVTTNMGYNNIYPISTLLLRLHEERYRRGRG